MVANNKESDMATESSEEMLERLEVSESWATPKKNYYLLNNHPYHTVSKNYSYDINLVWCGTSDLCT